MKHTRKFDVIKDKKNTGLDTKISLVIGLDLKVSPVNAYT